MVETIATPTATPIVTATTEQVKIALLALLNEGNPQLHAWINTALNGAVTSTISVIEPPKPPENGHVKKRVPVRELPFWKAHPEWESLTPPEGGSITKETLEELQELFKDAPPTEEIISYLTK